MGHDIGAQIEPLEAAFVQNLLVDRRGEQGGGERARPQRGRALGARSGLDQAVIRRAGAVGGEHLLSKHGIGGRDGAHSDPPAFQICVALHVVGGDQAEHQIVAARENDLEARPAFFDCPDDPVRGVARDVDRAAPEREHDLVAGREVDQVDVQVLLSEIA
jgi:hypothetical protein